MKKLQKILVPHRGFEPRIVAVRGRCPGPLDECGLFRKGGLPVGSRPFSICKDSNVCRTGQIFFRPSSRRPSPSVAQSRRNLSRFFSSPPRLPLCGHVVAAQRRRPKRPFSTPDAAASPPSSPPRPAPPRNGRHPLGTAWHHFDTRLLPMWRKDANFAPRIGPTPDLVVRATTQRDNTNQTHTTTQRPTQWEEHLNTARHAS